MSNVVAVMLFLGAESAAFLVLSKVAKVCGISGKLETLLAAALIAVLFLLFGLLFGFDGYVIPDWSERARRP